MSSSPPETLAKLRAIRRAIEEDDAPRLVNFRDAPEGTPAWEAFVTNHRVPGYGVRRATLVEWLDQVIDRVAQSAPAVSSAAAEPRRRVPPELRAPR